MTRFCMHKLQLLVFQFINNDIVLKISKLANVFFTKSFIRNSWHTKIIEYEGKLF